MLEMLETLYILITMVIYHLDKDTPLSHQFLFQALTDINGCKNTAKATVIAYPTPIPAFAYSPNPATILAPTIQFLNQSSGANITSYNWDFGDNYSAQNISQLVNPTHTYQDTGTYYVTLLNSSSNGCFASITEPIVIEPDFTLYVPSSFTPNGDGKNELFKAQGEGVLGFKMYIFDRWGNTIFTSNNIDTGWDGARNNTGEVLQEDVYVWKINLSNVLKQGKSFTGTVTLIK